MIAVFVLAAMLSPQTVNPAPAAAPAPVRVEKMTPEELKALTDAQKAVADAEAKVAAAKRALKGAQEGVELSHHANTDCGCYVQGAGRDYDKVEFKGDSIVIQHIHEAPSSNLRQ
ncbi:MAG TPA: hypothetical protein VGM27_12040 [Acidobacteriaceae bacterium]